MLISLLFQVKEEFDVILALSITKWIHINWGDDGLKRFFRRIYLHLRPGGKLILEPQDYKSYYKRAKLTVSKTLSEKLGVRKQHQKVFFVFIFCFSYSSLS